MIARLRRFPDVARALRASRELEFHDRWSARQLRAHRQARLLAIVRHAVAHSPYYRERFRGIELSDDLDVTALPTLDKETMIEQFDGLVTDRRLTLTGVEAHLGELERARRDADPRLLGEYRVIASGGSSGRRGLFVFGRKEWTEAYLAGALRIFNAYFGLGPRLPRRRLATVLGESPLHSSGRSSRSLDVGAYRALRLDARTPLGELVESLNSFGPGSLSGFASVVALLAERQLAGELRIAPEVVVTMGEVRTAEMEERITAAWGRTPFNVYGITEDGLVAADCDRHTGMHVFEDLALLEVVDERHRPVSVGTPGSRILITSFFGRTQPLIRYELTDLATVSPDPCPCGRPFPLLESLDGRSDDVLELPAAAGGTVSLHPLALRSPMVGLNSISEYRIVYERGELRVEVVPAGRSGEEACREVEKRLERALAERGARASLRAETVREIPRHPQSGKRRLVETRSTEPLK